MSRSKTAVVYIRVRPFLRSADHGAALQAAASTQLEASRNLAKHEYLSIDAEYIDSTTDSNDNDARKQLLSDLKHLPKHTVIVAPADNINQLPEVYSSAHFRVICATQDFCAAYANDDNDGNSDVIECPDPMLHSAVLAGKAGT